MSAFLDQPIKRFKCAWRDLHVAGHRHIELLSVHCMTHAGGSSVTYYTAVRNPQTNESVDFQVVVDDGNPLEAVARVYVEASAVFWPVTEQATTAPPADLHTRTLTLVIQRVCSGDESFKTPVAAALIEYATDCLLGTGGNGQFERHVTLNRCRIEAIASIAPVPGDEAREGLAKADGMQALRDRLELAREMADFLVGGENAGEITTALGYSPEEAAKELRAKLTEALEAL